MGLLSFSECSIVSGESGRALLVHRGILSRQTPVGVPLFFCIGGL